MLAMWALATLGVAPPRLDTTLSFQRYSYAGRYGPVGDEWPYALPAVGLALGYGWSDHHRTEIEVTASSSAYTQGHYWVGGPYAAFVAHEHRHDRVALTQWIQLRRNAWVHPQVGVGLAADFDRRESRLDPAPYELDDGPKYATRAERERALALHPSRTAVTLEPFAAGALKLYLSQRAFLRGGISVSLRGGRNPWRLFLGVGRDW